MQYTYQGVLSQLQTNLSLLSNWTKTLYYGVYQRLLEVVAYVIDKFIYMAQFYYNESGWLTAQRTESLANQAYFLQYIAHRKIGSIGYVNISADPTFSSSYVYTGNNIVIPKWTIIKSKDNLFNTYVTKDTSYLVNYIGPLAVNVSEGKPASFVYTAQGTANETISIYSGNIDTNNMEVWVIDLSGNKLYQVNIIKNIYLAPDMINYYCEVINVPDFSSVNIVFGDGIDALQLVAGMTIEILYGVTQGNEGVISSIGVLNTISNTLYDIYGNKVTLYSINTESISGGSSVETVESIRNNAPNIYQTGYRLGTDLDWNNVINSVSYIKTGSAWALNNTGLSTLSAQENTVYITALNTSGTDLTTDQLDDLTLNILYPMKSITEVITYQPVQKIYIGASGSVEMISNINNSMALGLIQTALDNKFGSLYTTFNTSAFSSKITSTVDNIPEVIQHNLDFFNVQKDYENAQGVILPLTATVNNIALYPIYSGTVATDNIFVYPNSCKIWVNDGIHSGPILIANEVGGVFSSTNPSYHVSGAINYTNNQNSCSYYITSGAVSNVYLSYKTQDSLTLQTSSIRLQQGWQITDIDPFMLIFNFSDF